MDGDRHHFERGAGEHHHRVRELALCRRERGEIFGVSGKGKARAVQHGLGDGVGHDGGCRSLLYKPHGVLDRLPDSGGGRRVGVPGNHRARDRNRQHGEFFGEALFGRLGFGDRGNRHPETKCLGALFKYVDVTEQHESRDWLPALRQPGRKRDVRPDPCGIAKGKR